MRALDGILNLILVGFLIWLGCQLVGLSHPWYAVIVFAAAALSILEMAVNLTAARYR